MQVAYEQKRHRRARSALLGLTARSGRLLGATIAGLSLFCFLLCAALPVDVRTESYLALTVGLLVIALALRPRAGLSRLILLLLCLLLSLRYFTWRFGETIVYYDPVSFAGSVLLLLAELYGLAMMLLGLFTNIMPITRTIDPAPLGTADPRVDVLIPSYNEGADLLAVTVCAATQIRYPHGRIHVHLLDDGGTDQKCDDPDPARALAAQTRRRDLQALCERFGITYRTRPFNRHAKAGNINHALPHLTGDLVLILDADHVPTADILARTVPLYRTDARLFMIQTPHFFMNPDTVEKNLDLFQRMPAENEMFHRAIQSGLDFWNSSFFCGSAAIIHRGRLLEVGGIATKTVTEDAETALALHSKGYSSAYVARPMVAGLAPETFTGMVTQRARWGQGMLQILLLERPLTRTGLTVGQRLGYLGTMLYWLFPYVRLVFLGAPVAYLIFGLKIYAANVDGVCAFVVPHVFALFISNTALFNRFRWPLVSHVYETLLGLLMLGPLSAVLRNPRSPDFKVTPKGEQTDSDFVSPLVRPFYAVFAITALALPMGVWRVVTDARDRNMVLITMGWEIFNLLVLLGALGALFERKQRRAVPRLAADMAAVLACGDRRIPGRITNLSTGGTQFAASTAISRHELDGELTLDVEAPHLEQPVRLAVVLRAQSGVTCGLAFKATDEQFGSVVALVHGDSERWSQLWKDPARTSGAVNAFRIMAQTGIVALASHAIHLNLGFRAAGTRKPIRRGPPNTKETRNALFGKIA